MKLKFKDLKLIEECCKAHSGALRALANATPEDPKEGYEARARAGFKADQIDRLLGELDQYT